ncbi:sigma-70 family RNA polymerase sigma factor [Patescibacteria group bacterium]|nr:sigma-70 family RNA polymerase sigma factor [Patescibacteria group bacterium]
MSELHTISQIPEILEDTDISSIEASSFDYIPGWAMYLLSDNFFAGRKPLDGINENILQSNNHDREDAMGEDIVDLYSEYEESDYDVRKVLRNLRKFHFKKAQDNKKDTTQLSDKDMKSLFEKMKTSKDPENIKEEIFYHNIGLVFFALRFVLYRKDKFSNEDIYEEMVNEGMAGLFESIDQFDYTRENTFSTFAIQSIEWRIKRCYVESKSFDIHIPRRTFSQDIIPLGLTYDELITSLKRYPSYTELADSLGISIEKLKETLSYINMLHFQSIEDVDLPDTDDYSIDTIEDNLAYKPLLLPYIERFPSRTREMLSLYYNIDGKNDKTYTYSNIGEIFGISRERVRQIFDTVHFGIIFSIIRGEYRNSAMSKSYLPRVEIPDNTESLLYSKDGIERLITNISKFHFKTTVIEHMQNYEDLFVALQIAENIDDQNSIIDKLGFVISRDEIDLPLKDIVLAKIFFANIIPKILNNHEILALNMIYGESRDRINGLYYAYAKNRNVIPKILKYMQTIYRCL